MRDSNFQRTIWSKLTDTHMHNESELINYNAILYHYTTASGLVGILQSNRLWATSAIFMNDVNELNYGTKFIKDFILEQKEKTNDKNMITLLSELYDRYDPYIRVEDSLDTYIACFSEMDDQLSQWKGFSNQGVGYAIGFSSKEFLYQKRPFPYVFVSVRKVIYDEETQRRIIESEVKDYLKEIVGNNIDIIADRDNLNEY